MRELSVLVELMFSASDTFYKMAQSLGFHEFVELNGFIIEFTKVCERMLTDGIDFQQNRLRLDSRNSIYIGEKLGCLFGSTLMEDENMVALIRGLYQLGDNVDVSVEAERGVRFVLRIGPKKEVVGDDEREEDK